MQLLDASTVWLRPAFVMRRAWPRASAPIGVLSASCLHAPPHVRALSPDCPNMTELVSLLSQDTTSPCRGNTLHGGFDPLFENSTWDVLDSSATHIKLHFVSPAGAQVGALPCPVLTLCMPTSP